MAITIVGTSQAGSNNNGGDVTLTFDGTPAENDLVVVIGGRNDDDGVGVVGPTGYTEQKLSYDASGLFALGTWTKFLGATPDASVTFPGGGHNDDAVAVCSVVLRGVDQSTLLDAVITEATGQDANVDPASITTQTDGAWVLAVGATSNALAASAAPSGYVNLASAASQDLRRYSSGLATKEVASAGAEDPGTFNWEVQSGFFWRAFTVAIRPAGASAFDPANLAASVTDDDVTLTWDA